MAKQKLGPWQEAWVRSLESGRNKQGAGDLAQLGDDGEWRLCCLGIAEEVLLANGVELKTAVSPGGICRYGGDADPDNGRMYLEQTAIDTFGFHDKYGGIDTPAASPEEVAEIEKLAGEDGPYCRMTFLNDDLEWSFKKIAAFVRKYPHLVFVEPR